MGVPGLTCQLNSFSFLYNMADAGQYDIPTVWSKKNNSHSRQLKLSVVIEVTTLFSSFSLARHNPLMVHSTRTS
jgi:hypothetical protein